MDPSIPPPIKKASEEFAALKCKEGNVLKHDWLNNGPESLRQNLPRGWLKRCKSLFSGKALTLLSLGRKDLLKTKLFSYCDRQTDFEDCVALNPTRAELIEALGWVQNQDANPDWPRHVELSFARLAKRLGYEL